MHLLHMQFEVEGSHIGGVERGIAAATLFGSCQPDVRHLERLVFPLVSLLTEQATAMPAIRRSRRLARTPHQSHTYFDFFGLPAEIRSQIIDCLEAGPEDLNVAVDLEQHEERRRCNHSVLSDVLVVSKQCYSDFAPLFYSQRRVRFNMDVLRFADEYLARCTTLCLHNLRYLECSLYHKNLYQRVNSLTNFHKQLLAREVTRLATLFECYNELRLHEFVLRYYATGYAPTILPDGMSSMPVHENRCTQIDRDNDFCFSRLNSPRKGSALYGMSRSWSWAPQINRVNWSDGKMTVLFLRSD